MFRSLLACVLLVSAVAAEPVMRVSAPEGMDTSVTLGAQIMSEAYRRVGYRMTLERLPSLRSLAMVNSGDYDAELGRVAGVDQLYTNLLPVPTAPVSLQVFAVSTTETIRPASWQALAPYRIGAVRGAKIVEMHTKGMAVSYAPVEENLLAMLQAGRVEVLMLGDVLANLALAQLRKKATVPLVVTPFERIPVYHYVNKRNQSLIMPLDEALRAMHKDGFIERVLQDARRDKDAIAK